jgi:Ca-activated chloride channel family protein
MKFTQLHLLYYLIPAVLVVLLVRWRRRHHYLSYSSLSQQRLNLSKVSKIVYLPVAFQWAALFFLLLAGLDPVLTFAEEEIQFRGLDIVLVVDLSSSMEQALPIDATEAEKYIEMDSFFAPSGKNPSRLDAVKMAVKDFVSQRRNDRIGLVVFSSNAYVVSPMTMDYDYLTGYIDMMEHRTLVGEGLTAIGEGVYLASSLIEKQNEDRQDGDGDKLLVILTDGENNYGRSPIRAVEKAAEKGFKLYLIGVDIPHTPLTTRLIGAIQYAQGAYYDVRNQEQLNSAYWEIGALEKGDFGVKEYHRSIPFYHQSVLASVLCLGLALGLRGFSYFTDLS